MVTLTIKRRWCRPKTIQVASCWQDLTGQQVIAYTAAIYQFARRLYKLETVKRKGKTVTVRQYADKSCYYYAKTELLRILFLPHKKIYRKLDAGQKHSLIAEFELTEFLETTSPDSWLHANPCPVMPLKYKGQAMHGPLYRFDELQALEYTVADALYFEYTTTHTPATLDKFITVLYRPKGAVPPGHPGYTGDVRTPYNDNNTALYLTWAAALPHPAKLAVYLWYSHAREGFTRRYAALYSGGGKNKGGPADVLRLLNSMAGEKFGPIEKTYATKIGDIFFELERLKQEADELKRKLKQ